MVWRYISTNHSEDTLDVRNSFDKVRQVVNQLQSGVTSLCFVDGKNG